jgi:Kef-type K+ transport system membrane component KefB
LKLQLAIHFFLQLVVILAACRIVGWFGRRFLGQTQVVMEMVAGVLLGPSLFGLLAPELQTWLFPRMLEVKTADGLVATVHHPSMVILFILAQIGLALYMFLIGLEFNIGLLKGRGRAAALVSGAGIVVPFALGGLLVPLLFKQGGLFTAEVNLWTAVLFVGSAMSITAFPMLARILYERGIARTAMGTLTLAAGSIDDALAWCFLAVVLATFQGTPASAWVTVLGGLAYGLFTLTVGRMLFRKFGERFARNGNHLTNDLFTAVMLVLAFCAFVTDSIGIYAVFGAFICGAAMPKGKFAEVLTERMEMLVTNFMLPFFFVYSGLNTQISLVNSLVLWEITFLVCLVAIVGKGVACMLAAKVTGEGWRSSAIIGTLMNARGLMELILLNIGLERGVITPTLFTIMVMMAIITTGMASPIYRILSKNFHIEGAVTPPDQRGQAAAGAG